MFDGKDCSGLGGVDPHTSCDDSRGIAETQVGRLLADDLDQVSGPRCCLIYQSTPVHRFSVKFWQPPGPVIPSLN